LKVIEMTDKLTKSKGLFFRCRNNASGSKAATRKSLYFPAKTAQNGQPLIHGPEKAAVSKLTKASCDFPVRRRPIGNALGFCV